MQGDTEMIEQMRTGLRRPLQTYVLHGIWIVWAAFQYSTKNISETQLWILLITTVFVVVSLIHIIIRRNYFEVENGKLIIHKAFFWTKTIDLDKIEKIIVEPGLISSSKIILKDKTRIKYLESQTKDEELKKFMSQFNIQVE